MYLLAFGPGPHPHYLSVRGTPTVRPHYAKRFPTPGAAVAVATALLALHRGGKLPPRWGLLKHSGYRPVPAPK